MRLTQGARGREVLIARESIAIPLYRASKRAPIRGALEAPVPRSAALVKFQNSQTDPLRNRVVDQFDCGASSIICNAVNDGM